MKYINKEGKLRISTPYHDEDFLYKIVCSTRNEMGISQLEFLSARVTEEISDGWRPKGGFIALRDGGFGQAMVKDSDKLSFMQRLVRFIGF